MCTAISFNAASHFFGRNLDLDHCYQESVTVTPENYPFIFREARSIRQHPALIGIATVCDGYPLYYDATNEYGLSMAGLNFPGHAFYPPAVEGKSNIAPFELIPWVLCQCATTAEAKTLLQNTNIAPIPFSDRYPLTDLHWMISDSDSSLVVESVGSGLQLYDNPFHVLTNNPPFPFHAENIANYLHLDTSIAENHFLPQLTLFPHSAGGGAIGLPGDLSSVSRFIRAAFTRGNSTVPEREEEAVGQFFHLLAAVAQTKGCVQNNQGLTKTIYSSCCDTKKGIYYYTTYENSQITAVDMHRVSKNKETVTAFPLLRSQQIRWEACP